MSVFVSELITVFAVIPCAIMMCYTRHLEKEYNDGYLSGTWLFWIIPIVIFMYMAAFEAGLI